MSVSPADFRRTLGRFATGVTVVLGDRGGRLLGMTVNAFTSVSLDPPLILFCPARDAALAGLAAGDPFTVSILAGDQTVVSEAFAADSDPAPHVLEPWDGWDGPPRVRAAAAALACRTRAVYDGGDHEIVLAEVERLAADPTAEPLVYLDGSYRRVAPPTPEREP